MRLLSFITLAAMLTAAAPAYSLEHSQFSLGVGTNFNMPVTEGDIDSSTDEELSVTLAIAAKEELKINDQWFIRTGLWLQEKSAKYSIDTLLLEGDVAANIIYASIPLNLQYKATDLISIFGGYIADVRINDYCSASGDFDSCTLDEESKSVVHVGTLGMSFNFSQLLTLDVSWQQGLSDVYADELKINTLQVQLFFKF
jgi:hypothetical protein